MTAQHPENSTRRCKSAAISTNWTRRSPAVSEYKLHVNVPQFGVMTQRNLPQRVELSLISKKLELATGLVDGTYTLHIRDCSEEIEYSKTFDLSASPGRALVLRARLVRPYTSLYRSLQRQDSLRCPAEPEVCFNTAFLAANRGMESVCQQLAEHIPDIVHMRTPHGRTLLHAAAAGNQPDILDFLVENSCSLTAEDSDGRTALELAAENGASTCERRLRLHFWQLKRINITPRLDVTNSIYQPPSYVEPLDKPRGQQRLRTVDNLHQTLEVSGRAHTGTDSTTPEHRAVVEKQVTTGDQKKTEVSDSVEVETKATRSQSDPIQLTTPHDKELDQCSDSDEFSMSTEDDIRPQPRKSKERIKSAPAAGRKTVSFEEWLKRKRRSGMLNDRPEKVDIYYPEPGETLNEAEFESWLDLKRSSRNTSRSSSRMSDRSTPRHLPLRAPQPTKDGYRVNSFLLKSTDPRSTFQQDAQYYKDDYFVWLFYHMEANKHRAKRGTRLTSKSLSSLQQRVSHMREMNSQRGCLYEDWMETKQNEILIKQKQERENRQKKKELKEQEQRDSEWSRNRLKERVKEQRKEQRLQKQREKEIEQRQKTFEEEYKTLVKENNPNAIGFNAWLAKKRKQNKKADKATKQRNRSGEGSECRRDSEGAYDSWWQRNSEERLQREQKLLEEEKRLCSEARSSPDVYSTSPKSNSKPSDKKKDEVTEQSAVGHTSKHKNGDNNADDLYDIYSQKKYSTTNHGEKVA